MLKPASLCHGLHSSYGHIHGEYALVLSAQPRGVYVSILPESMALTWRILW